MFKIYIHLFFSLIFIVSSVSCVSTTTVRAVDANGNVDSDVNIYVDRQNIGKGEAKYSDRKTVYSAVPYYELRKEGCKTLREKLNVRTNWLTTMGGAILAGVGFGLMGFFAERGNTGGFSVGASLGVIGIIPLFWTREYTPVQEQTFQCIKVNN